MTNKYALLSLQHNEVGHLITLLVASKFLTSNMHLLDTRRNMFSFSRPDKL